MYLQNTFWTVENSKRTPCTEGPSRERRMEDSYGSSSLHRGDNNGSQTKLRSSHLERHYFDSERTHSVSNYRLLPTQLA